MIGQDELRRRLLGEAFLLRTVETLMERGPVLTRCKLCEAVVERGREDAHWRDHVRARDRLRRRAEDQAYARRVAALTKARHVKMRGGEDR